MTDLGFEGATEQIDALIRRLTGLRNYTVKRICEESVKKASDIIYEEERRNISAESEERMEKELILITILTQDKIKVKMVITPKALLTD